MPDEEKKRTHDKFNASDSDVTIESADGVLFCLHTQNLKINTGAFPGSEFSTEGQPTKLTEDSDVLEVLFAYVYPQRHPNLENMEFSLLAKIAEAVEKYEVFPPMNLCALRMNEFLPQHADDVLVFGVKHDYPKLINEAALALSRSPLMSKFIHKFSPLTVVAWIRYSESWQAIFASAYATVVSLLSSTSPSLCNETYSPSVCALCQKSLLQWVMKLEKITSLATLKDGLNPWIRRNNPELTYCTRCNYSKECSAGTASIAQIIRNGIDNIRPFEQYLREAGDT